MSKYILNGTDWKLTGWARHQWQYEKMMETGGFSVPVVPEISADVPGSVQTALLKAGVIEDWNIETNFRNIEWIEHREWVYHKEFTVSEKADKYYLHFYGLDFSGFVFLNGKKVLEFNQMMLRYSVNVTNYIRPNEHNVLKIVFLQPPEIDGQVGYTSKVSVLKSRFNYGWDWCPRLVNIGIFRDVWLETVNVIKINDYFPKTDIIGDRGVLSAEMIFESTENTDVSVLLSVKRNKKEVASVQKSLAVLCGENRTDISLDIIDVEKWFPNSFGKQPLYEVKVSFINKNGTVLCEEEKTVGFKSLEYILPDGAPEGCLKYSFKINGKTIPIRGVNLVPLSPFYGSVTESDYRYSLKKFVDMGCTLVRVWGGAAQESESFYRICDELGLLVWQEFPQSSSGIENAPNEDKDYLNNLYAVAKEYILRARGHVSLVFWCGGNELYYGSELYPADERNSKNLLMLKNLVKEYNPKVNFLPASPSKYITGDKHIKGKNDWSDADCHGPWLYGGIDDHYDTIEKSTAVLFSEIGTPACSRPEILNKYCKTNVWPPDYTNSYWCSRGAWWIQYDTLSQLFGDFEVYSDRLSAYAAAFRFIQAESLRSMVGAVRYAGTKKSGIIIWMGNEPFPNAANTSLLEYDGCPKPAYYELRKCFAPVMLGLKYNSLCADEDGKVKIGLYACSDSEKKIGDVNLRVYDNKGDIIKEFNLSNVCVNGVSYLTSTEFELKSGIALVRVKAYDCPELSDDWVFTGDSETPLKGLLRTRAATVKLEQIESCTYKVTNISDEIAYYNEIIGKAEDGRMATFSQNYYCLLPGESRVCHADRELTEICVSQMNQL